MSWGSQFSSVTQSCLTLRDSMNRSTPGLPVQHQLPEFTQTHVHRVSDAIQPSHPLLSPSPSAPNPSQHQGLFQWVKSSHEVAKVLEFQLQHHSLQRNPRADLLPNGLVGSPCSPRDSQESSPTPQFKSINSLALSLLHSPTLTSIHDHILAMARLSLTTVLRSQYCGLPWWLSGVESTCQSGSVPDPGGSHILWISWTHAPQLLNLCSRAWEPPLLSPWALEPALHNQRSPCSEKPMHPQLKRNLCRNEDPAQP